MIDKLFKYCLVLMVGFLNYRGSAQDENRISGVANIKKDSVMLRWVPETVPLWQTGIKYGYIIRRYTIAKDGVFIPDGLNKSLLLTKQPVRPVSSERFDILADSDDRAAIVQEAIYGADFQLNQSDNISEFLKKYEELEVRLGFALFICDMSIDISKAAGLYFADHNITEGERYAYSISPANIPDGMQAEPAVIVVDAGSVTGLPEVYDVQCIFLDKVVKFRWPIMIYRGIYSAYVLEKSLDGKNFKPVSDLPLVNFSEEENPEYFLFTDSLETNYQQTWYRIKGINPFGETGPPSEVVTGKGLPDFKAYATIDSAWLTGGEKVAIRWRVTESNDSHVRNINVMRAGSYNGTFVQLNKKPLDARSRNFTDDHPGISNYYQVVLVGEGNLKSSSFPYLVQTEDTDPPSVPAMLTGKVDSSGIVTIIWKENTDPDLMGYKVFRANSITEDFISLGRNIITKNLCIDTINLNTLTQKIYYQVVAIDKNYNSSDYSAVLELSRPDTIAPSPAIITRISFNGGKVSIEQESSPSKDVSRYELYRHGEKDTIPRQAAAWDKNLPASFTDIPALNGQNITYTLRTFDSSGNKSEISRKVYAENASHNEINLTARQSTDGRTITIGWNIPSGFTPTKTIIYRSIDKEPLSILITLASNELMFNDPDVEINTVYNYMVLIYGSGNEVLRSKLVFSPSVRNK